MFMLPLIILINDKVYHELVEEIKSEKLTSTGKDANINSPTSGTS